MQLIHAFQKGYKEHPSYEQKLSQATMISHVLVGMAVLNAVSTVLSKTRALLFEGSELKDFKTASKTALP